MAFRRERGGRDSGREAFRPTPIGTATRPTGARGRPAPFDRGGHLAGFDVARKLSRRDFIRSSAAGAGAILAASAVPAFARVGPNHCGWGAFAEPVGSQTPMQAIFRMENLINRKLDVTRHYVSWDRDLANDQVRQSAATGHIPLVSLECQRSDGSFIKWADIAGGRHDTELTAKAHGLRDWGKHAYFVFNHEPENDIGSGNAEAFRAAYNHTRQLFGANGATNLRWVCTLMAPTYGGAHGGAKKWVPAAAQVLGADGYNRGGCSDKGWQTFAQIFGGAHRYAKRRHRPLLIQEWGTVGRNACHRVHAESKASWIRHACAQIKQWQLIETVIYT
ncbi:MAG: hypothetical protein M3P18_07225, partial [Actinomycetota bacterium]|nr:hypothetical protein [Actinomycetota bacterium]